MLIEWAVELGYESALLANFTARQYKFYNVRKRKKICGSPQITP